MDDFINVPMKNIIMNKWMKIKECQWIPFQERVFMKLLLKIYTKANLILDIDDYLKKFYEKIYRKKFPMSTPRMKK